MADVHDNATIPAVLKELNSTLRKQQRAIAGAARPVVTFGLPWLSAGGSLRWLGPRVVFWPQGVPLRHRVSLISSRLKRRLDEETWWFDLLRTAVLRTDPTIDVLCAVEGTAPHRFVCRAAELFGRSLLDFHVDAVSQTVSIDKLSTWLTGLASGIEWDSSSPITETDLVAEPPLTESYASGKRWDVFVSPPIAMPDVSPVHESSTVASLLADQPVADRILFAAGNRLQILQTRRAGAIHSLLNLHVQDEDRRTAFVMLASDSAGQFPAIVSDESGCVVPWLLKPVGTDTDDVVSSANGVTNTGTILTKPPQEEAQGLLTSPLSKPEDWLLHWTRSTVGPWPDQPQQEFDDELILGCRSSDRSALATLLRIVNEGRLWATSEAIRGGFRVVSFTAVPLHEFRSRRTYRKHRHRYDFEPWGVAIRKDTLTAVGGRPVEYGDDATWNKMSKDDQPFFQNVGTGDGWTKDEREWRVTEHIQLQDLPDCAVAVFVDSAAAQEIVRTQTRWPVFVVPDH